MKKLNFMAVGLLLLIVLCGCRRSESERYQKYLEITSDSTSFEVVTPPEDKVKLAEEEAKQIDPHDNDSVYGVPSIPQDHGINMSASDDEAEKIMRGEAD